MLHDLRDFLMVGFLWFVGSVRVDVVVLWCSAEWGEDVVGLLGDSGKILSGVGART